MRDEMIRIARAEVGVREEGGPNSGARVRVYQAATWLKPGAWPWCAAFTAWVLQQALATPAGQTFLRGADANAWRCKDASAFGWLGWAKARKLIVSKTPRAGDIVVYDFNGPSAGGGHIGLVTHLKPLSELFHTVEGNTGPDGGREGDGVYAKLRGRSSVVGFIRLGDRA